MSALVVRRTSRGRGGRRSRTRPGLVAAVLATGSLLGCELQEITVAEPEDIVIVEGQVVVALELGAGPGGSEPVERLLASVFLHRTFGDGQATVPGAQVAITDTETDVEIVLTEVPQAGCVPVELPGGVEPPFVGSCYRSTIDPSPFPPGSSLSLEVTTADGRRLSAASRIPGTFDLDGLDHALLDVPPDRLGRVCTLPSEANYRIAWTPSEGTWAYLAETSIFGLDQGLAPQGIEAPEQLFLDGLAVGGDTDIVFPAEFGVFDRFDLDRDLSLALQEGLPPGASAVVAVSAMDRNWVNWARGGNFNPSGAVRIPSVFGDGTGVFGTAVRRQFAVWVVDEPIPDIPTCGALEP